MLGKRTQVQLGMCLLEGQELSRTLKPLHPLPNALLLRIFFCNFVSPRKLACKGGFSTARSATSSDERGSSHCINALNGLRLRGSHHGKHIRISTKPRSPDSVYAHTVSPHIGCTPPLHGEAISRYKNWMSSGFL